MNRFRCWLRWRVPALHARSTAVRVMGVGALAFMLLPVLAGSPAAAETYTIIDLGTLGGPQSQAYAINAAGQVVGKADLVGARDAFLYVGTRMRDLGSLGGGLSTAHGINDTGQVAGEFIVRGGSYDQTHAFLYDSSGMHDILGGNQSIAWGVNASGQVAGTSEGGAFLYSAGAVQYLGDAESEARAINDAGQVVGRAGYRAFLYDGTGMHDLGALPGGSSSFAFGINNAGQVVGNSDRADGMKGLSKYSCS